MSDQLAIYTLGSLSVQLEGQPVSFSQRKASALLVYLACNPRPHPREVLAEMLWEDRTQSQSLANLRVVLTDLRQAVGPYVTIARDTVDMTMDNIWWLDVAEFESRQRVAGTQPAQLEALVKLYRGDFLEGFYVESQSFEGWARLERERLRFMAVDVLDTIIGVCLSQGNYAAGIEHVSQLLRIDPLREEAYRQLMELLARSGQRTAALNQYETCRRVLTESLGVEPAPQTVALYERIRHEDFAQWKDAERGEVVARLPTQPGVQRPRHNLPMQSTSFIGREEDIAAVAKLLRAPDCRLLTLVGMGGIGKTRLALAVAERFVDAFEHGVSFISLDPLHSADDLVATLASTLGFQFHGEEQYEETQLLDNLRGMEMLLVLDNFEHLLDGANFVERILMTAPGVHLLVTSREPLKLTGEWRYEVGGMRLPDRADTDFAQYSAVQLFAARALQIRHDFVLEDDPELVIRVCHSVGGMPLGIELAAAWLDTLSPADIAEEIARNMDILESGVRDRPARQRSIRAVLETAWARLGGAERDVFMQLSVFQGGFTREAAELVAGATLPILARLVDRAVLRRDPTAHYRLHELLRQYAGERLELAGETASTQHRHADYYAALVERVAPPVFRPELYQPATLDLLETEYDNLRAAIDWSLAHDDGVLATRLVGAAHRFLVIRAHYVEGLRWAERILENRPETASEEVVKVLVAASELADSLGKPVKAHTYVTEALHMARVLEHKPLTGYALFLLADHELSMLGDNAVAQSLLEEARELFQEAGTDSMVGAVLNSLGDVARVRGNLEQAAQYFEESLVQAIEQGISPVMRPMGLGEVLLQLGDEERAKELFRLSLDNALRIGNPVWIAMVILSTAQLATTQGNPQVGARLLGASQAALETAGYSLDETSHRHLEDVTRLTRNHLDGASFDLQWAEGHAMPLNEAVSAAKHALEGTR